MTANLVALLDNDLRIKVMIEKHQVIESLKSLVEDNLHRISRFEAEIQELKNENQTYAKRLESLQEASLSSESQSTFTKPASVAYTELQYKTLSLTKELRRYILVIPKGKRFTSEDVFVELEKLRPDLGLTQKKSSGSYDATFWAVAKKLEEDGDISAERGMGRAGNTYTKLNPSSVLI